MKYVTSGLCLAVPIRFPCANSSLAGPPTFSPSFPLPWFGTPWVAKMDGIPAECPKPNVRRNQNLYWQEKCLPTPDTLLKASSSFLNTLFKANRTYRSDRGGGTLPFQPSGWGKVNIEMFTWILVCLKVDILKVYHAFERHHRLWKSFG